MKFKDLKVWNKSMDLVEEVYKLTLIMPEHEKYGIVSQIRRSAVSIPSNIAEGHSRNTTKEYLQFLYISKGSLSELITQIEISERIGYIKSEKLCLFYNLSKEIYLMLSKIIYSLKK